MAARNALSRCVARDACRVGAIRRCASAFGDALELAPVLEHRLFARGLAAREPRLGVGKRRSEPVALRRGALGGGGGGAFGVGETNLERREPGLQRGDLAAPLLGERLAVVELRFGATALHVNVGQDALDRAELAAQFVGFPSRRFEIADARRRRLLQRDEAHELPSDLDFPRRGRLFGGAQPPFEPDDLDRVLGAQRVSVGDRLRFARAARAGGRALPRAGGRDARPPAPRPTPTASRLGTRRR